MLFAHFYMPFIAQKNAQQFHGKPAWRKAPPLGAQGCETDTETPLLNLLAQVFFSAGKIDSNPSAPSQ